MLNPPPLQYRGGSRQSTGPRRERRGGPRRSAGAPTSVSYHAKGGSRGRADHRATASKCANTHGSEGGGQPDGSLGKSTPENTGLRGPTTPANHPRTKIRILHAPPYRNQKAKDFDRTEMAYSEGASSARPCLEFSIIQLPEFILTRLEN